MSLRNHRSRVIADDLLGVISGGEGGGTDEGGGEVGREGGDRVESEGDDENGTKEDKDGKRLET